MRGDVVGRPPVRFLEMELAELDGRGVGEPFAEGVGGGDVGGDDLVEVRFETFGIEDFGTAQLFRAPPEGVEKGVVLAHGRGRTREIAVYEPAPYEDFAREGGVEAREVASACGHDDESVERDLFRHAHEAALRIPFGRVVVSLAEVARDGFDPRGVECGGGAREEARRVDELASEDPGRRGLLQGGSGMWDETEPVCAAVVVRFLVELSDASEEAREERAVERGGGFIIR